MSDKKKFSFGIRKEKKVGNESDEDFCESEDLNKPLLIPNKSEHGFDNLNGLGQDSAKYANPPPYNTVFPDNQPCGQGYVLQQGNEGMSHHFQQGSPAAQFPQEYPYTPFQQTNSLAPFQHGNLVGTFFPQVNSAAPFPQVNWDAPFPQEYPYTPFQQTNSLAPFQHGNLVGTLFPQVNSAAPFPQENWDAQFQQWNLRVPFPQGNPGDPCTQVTPIRQGNPLTAFQQVDPGIPHQQENSGAQFQQENQVTQSKQANPNNPFQQANPNNPFQQPNPRNPFCLGNPSNPFQQGNNYEDEDTNKYRYIQEEDIKNERKRFLDCCHVVSTRTPTTYLAASDQTYLDRTSRIRKYDIGKQNNFGKINEKVIMVVGATGSGKTTLINGMFNYIFGVEWDDDLRLKLIEEEIEMGHAANQAKSQTSWITSYTIQHKEWFKIPFNLTIIDTPGFGDTSGIKRDREITDQIKQFFSTKGLGGVDHIDAIGFVAQSSLARLTHTQKYIFDSILALFGKDIEENIIMLLTFADGQNPQVLSGLDEAKMPYTKYFKFNNSALFTQNKARCKNDDGEESEFAELFWKMGEKSFQIFFKHLDGMKTKSLLLTKDVLEEREKLEILIEGIQQDIKAGLAKLEQLQVEGQVLRNHQADIDKNKDFTYTVNEQKVKTKPTDPGQYTTNCIDCNMTCHQRCGIPNDQDKARCWAMTNGSCRICPRKCSWDMHKNQPYVYVIEITKVTKTADDLKKRYEEAEGKRLTAEQIIKKCAEEFEEVQAKLIVNVNRVRQSIERLQQIALKPNPLSTVEYIDVLITAEKSNAHPGWQQRVKQLYKVRQQAEHMQKMANRGYDPFSEYQKKYQEEQKQNKPGVWTTVGKFLRRGIALAPGEPDRKMTNNDSNSDLDDQYDEEGNRKSKGKGKKKRGVWTIPKGKGDRKMTNNNSNSDLDDQYDEDGREEGNRKGKGKGKKKRGVWTTVGKYLKGGKSKESKKPVPLSAM